MYRAMLRGLLAHKLRLVLSALAVILGTMFMSGAFIGGDTVAKGFEALFSSVNANLDVRVTARNDAPVGPGGSQRVTTFVNQTVVDQVTALPGVQAATGRVDTDGARVVGKNGKVIPSSGPPRLGTGWVGSASLAQLRQGRAPEAADEIAINGELARVSGYTVGDRVDVVTLQPRKTFTVVGVFGYEGNRDSLGGEMTVAFTMPVAQELMLASPGSFTSVDVRAEPGVSDTVLRDRIAGALGPSFVVKTGKQTAADQAGAVQTFIGTLKTGLTVFALIGLFTGAFLIFNTFSMLVAQRTRELALYRAFGASRGQVNRAVLAEAVLLGLVSAVVGLLLGALVGWLLKTGLSALSKTSLPVSGVVVKPYVVLVTLLVGVVFTVAAALIPALRASRVPPIAAMRDAATPDKPLRRLTIAGAVVFAVGVALLALKLTNTVKDNLALLLGGGAALAFLGVAMLAPVIARPVTAAVGQVFSRSMPGRLGVRNTGRNPRRTAVTAAALMIGVTLATGAGVFAQSAKAGISSVFHNDLHAQLAILTDSVGGGPTLGGFAPSMVGQIKAVPGVSQAVAVQADFVRIGGSARQVVALDLSDARDLLGLTPVDGTLDDLGSGQFVVNEKYAKDHHLAIGDTLTMQTARGQTVTEKLVGIYADNKVADGPVISPADTVGFSSPFAQLGYVQVADPSQVDAVKARLDTLFRDNPEVNITDTQAVVDQAASFLDVVLAILNVLLGLTILVAVLGVINTLLLSVFERTREIGLIRAIGMSRGQLSRMITVESILISVFGALLGIVAGVALGVAIVLALRGDSGFLILTVPWGYLVAALVLAVVAGVFAAILPAIRAARLAVLEAIAYE